MRAHTPILILSIAATLVATTNPALAICREVTELGSDEPSIDPDQSVLIVKRPNAVVGYDCTVGDAGSAADGGVDDAGPQMQSSQTDAGQADAGPDDAGPDDAGPNDADVPDAGPDCRPIYGDAITMTVQPKFAVGENGARFALLMVTPKPPTITTASERIFRDLEASTNPLTEWNDIYIEDEALGYQCKDPRWNQPESQGCGSIGGSGTPDYPTVDPPSVDAGAGGDLFTVGQYQVGVIPAPNMSALQSWLDENSFRYDLSDLDALQPYVEMGWSVIAVRIDAQANAQGPAGLVPLSFTYPGTEMRLPLGLSRQSQFGQMFLRIYVAAGARYDIPGAHVGYAQRTSLGGATFLTRNDLWADLQRTADEDPIASLAAADTTVHDVVTRDREVRIPSSECPDRESDGASWVICGCNADGASPWGDEVGLIATLLLCAVLLRRRRRSRASA